MLGFIAVTKTHYTGLYPDKSPLTTCQDFELHDGNRSRHRVIENSLNIGQNHSLPRKHNEPQEWRVSIIKKE